MPLGQPLLISGVGEHYTNDLRNRRKCPFKVMAVHVHVNVYTRTCRCICTCTIDAWAFKGTATGTYSMYGSLVSVQISRTTTYPIVSDC